MVSKKISNQLLCSYTISAFPESFHLIFTSVLHIGVHYYLPFADEDPEAQRSYHVPKAIEWVCGGVGAEQFDFSS